MTFTFSQTTSKWAQVVSTCMLSNAAVTMYAILCECDAIDLGRIPEIADRVLSTIVADGMTPETFTVGVSIVASRRLDD